MMHYRNKRFLSEKQNMKFINIAGYLIHARVISVPYNEIIV